MYSKIKNSFSNSNSAVYHSIPYIKVVRGKKRRAFFTPKMNDSGGWPQKPPAKFNKGIAGSSGAAKKPSDLLNKADINKIYSNVEGCYNNFVSSENIMMDETPKSKVDINSTVTDKVTDHSLVASNKLQQLLANDNDCFIKVVERRKRAAQNNLPSSSKKSNTENINNNNRFILLQNQDKDEDKETPSDVINHQPEGDKWCPYINVSGLNTIAIHKYLMENFTDEMNLNRVQLVNRGHGNSAIRVKNVNLHNILFNNFKENNKIEGYSFTPKSLRNPSILMKGLTGYYPPNEVREELLKLDNSLNIILIKPFTTKWSRENNFDLDIFMCTVGSYVDISKLKKIKFVLHHRVWWDSFKREGPLQCYNCQRPGHGKRYCAYKPRCVKCNISHDVNNPEACSVKANEDGSLSEPYCVNCEIFGHPANYSNCPKRIQYMKNKEKRIALSNKIKFSRVAQVNSVVFNNNQKISYADMVKNNISNQPANNKTSVPKVGSSSIFGDFMNESIKLFGLPINILIAKVKVFWSEYQLLDEKDKAGKYLDFIMNLSP